MTEKSNIPRLFPDTFSIDQSELTGQYTGPIVRGRLFINDQHVSWGGTFNNGFFTYYVGPDRIQRHDKVELVGYDSGNNELTRAVVTIKVVSSNAVFKKNESLIRIQAERTDPISTKVVFFSHDRGTAKLLFKLEKDGAPQPLSNGTVVPICLEGGSETSDMGRFRHVYHAVIEDAAEGLVSIILKNNILGHQGRVDGSIYIKPPNDQQLDTAGRFLFHIELSPIDDMTESVSQFYYDGFYEIYEKLANAKQQVEDDLTEMRASVKAMLDEIEAEVDRYKDEAEAKFTAINNNLVSLAATITQLENRLTTVRNEIESLVNTLEYGGRNYLSDSESPKMLNYLGSVVTYEENQAVEAWRANNAVKHTVTGGTHVIMGTMRANRLVSLNVNYIHSIYIENTGSTNVLIQNNLGNTVTVLPGERTRVVFPARSSATGTPSMQFVFSRNRIEDDCEFILWRAMIAQGNVVGDWVPNSDELVRQRDFALTQQKVQTLEQNTIRITNQFPDHDFSKQVPQPVAESGLTVSYDAQGVVFNNPTNNQGRVYWGSPPLGLTVGKTYNVSMYVNANAASAGKDFIVGTSNGENFAFSLADNAAYWTQGTIGLTHWTAFSIWIPANSALRIRELYIYEANTDITTARLERLEKDNSLPPWTPQYEPGFMSYSGDGGVWHCQVERRGDMVALTGAIANSVAIEGTGIGKILMARLPVGYRPKSTVNRVMAGSGMAIFNMEIDPSGEVWMARYRGATASWGYSPVSFVGAWLNVGTTYLGEDI